MNGFKWVAAALASGLVFGTAQAQAQDASVPAPATTESVAAAGMDWRVVSRSSDRANLIDMNSLDDVDDTVTLEVARVRMTAPPGNYSHAVNLFAVRCRTGELHLIEESDIAADGVTAETYAVDEPWLPVAAGTVDEGIKSIACAEGELPEPGFPSIQAFIEAGRP